VGGKKKGGWRTTDFTDATDVVERPATQSVSGNPMSAPDKPAAGARFARLDQGVHIELKALLRRSRAHIEHGIPLDNADLDAVAGDPSALAGSRARKSLWEQHVEDSCAAFALAHALARTIVVCQTAGVLAASR
jgi:hypothetical protein